MPTFNSLDQLNKWVKKNASNIPLSNGKTLNQILKQEAERLRKIIIKHIANYYNSYSPEVYQRTMGLVNSLQVDPVVQNGNEISVKLWFDNNARHPSVFGQSDGYTAILIDTGWAVSSGWHKDIPHFGFQKGAKFIESSINEYNAGNKYGFKISVDYGIYSDLKLEI